MDKTEAMTKLLACAKTRAEELRAKADKEPLDDYDVQAAERIAAELDEAASVLVLEEGEQLFAVPENKAYLVLTEPQVHIVDRALTCFSKSLVAGARNV